jgi:hypothetical protein
MHRQEGVVNLTDWSAKKLGGVVVCAVRDEDYRKFSTSMRSAVELSRWVQTRRLPSQLAER